MSSSKESNKYVKEGRHRCISSEILPDIQRWVTTSLFFFYSLRQILFVSAGVLDESIDKYGERKEGVFISDWSFYLQYSPMSIDFLGSYSPSLGYPRFS